MYRSDYWVHNPAYVEHYNHILRSFHKASTSRSDNPCKSVYIADMALLMRHNGTKKSGWTDGMHPGPWVRTVTLTLTRTLSLTRTRTQTLSPTQP